MYETNTFNNVNEDTQNYKLITKLVNIGKSMSAEKNTGNLLSMILSECMLITNSDAGSIYIKVSMNDIDYLQFTVTQNNSISINLKKSFVPINYDSIAGYTALSKKIFNFNNMDDIFTSLGISHDSSFDKKNKYKTANMLSLPMKNVKNDVIGVMQLLNKKKNPNSTISDTSICSDIVIPYTNEEANIVASLASQAAILLERSKLYSDINLLLETFAESLVTTLDQRDPATAGHSTRVAKMSVKLAHAVNNSKLHAFTSIFFSEYEIKELFFASLLHDVGKIGVREHILLKESRLSKSEIEALKYKFMCLELLLKEKQRNKTISPQEIVILESANRYYEFVLSINYKGFITDAELELISEINRMNYIDENGVTKIELLPPHVLESLSVRKGNLTPTERTAIESHATFTEQILKEISWTKELKNVSNIAANHHERINGTGYPKGLVGASISMQSRIISIADIFDAMTASDRPYKCALPTDKALSILQADAKSNYLDSDLVNLFISEKIYDIER
ncbi:MAG: HD domain-containing protein [Clostridiales bacterium]|nr:HD domain-containing protein [Clostridiales bacterium]